MLERGIYTLAEASKYSGVAVTTLRSWFRPRSDVAGHRPIFKSDWDPVENDFALSFLNLIEAYVASFFKKQGVRPRLIRRAQEILQAEWGINHPFAFQDLRTDGKKIIIKSDDRQLIDVVSRQPLFEQMGPHLTAISYRTTDRIAEAWDIGKDYDVKGIVINPNVGFGRPVIEKTGISTLILANQFVANRKDAALVARLFDIPKDSVENAFRFEERLGRIAA